MIKKIKVVRVKDFIKFSAQGNMNLLELKK